VTFGLCCALSFEKYEEVEDFALHRLGCGFDFLNQRVRQIGHASTIGSPARQFNLIIAMVRTTASKLAG